MLALLSVVDTCDVRTCSQNRNPVCRSTNLILWHCSFCDGGPLPIRPTRQADSFGIYAPLVSLPISGHLSIRYLVRQP
jgi:hypothetical protein